MNNCRCSRIFSSHRTSFVAVVYFPSITMLGPPPFEDLGKKAEDLLKKEYNFSKKAGFSSLRTDGMSLTASGNKIDQTFIGFVHTVLKIGNTEVDVKADTDSTLHGKVTVNDVWPISKAGLSFILSNHNSGKLHVQYLHPHAAIDSSIGLSRTPQLELSATIGSKELCVGGEFGYHTAFRYCYSYTTGIGFNKPNFSMAVLLIDKGQALNAFYIHSINPFTSVAAEMLHGFPTRKTFITFGSSHAVDPFTLVKTRFSLSGNVAFLFQREWRPNSLIKFSAAYDFRKIYAFPRVGFDLVFGTI